MDKYTEILKIETIIFNKQHNNEDVNDFLDYYADVVDNYLNNKVDEHLDEILSSLYNYQYLENQKINNVIKKHQNLYQQNFNVLYDKLINKQEITQVESFKLRFLEEYLRANPLGNNEMITKLFNLYTINILENKNKEYISIDNYRNIIELYIEQFKHLYNLDSVILSFTNDNQYIYGSHISRRKYMVFEYIEINENLINDFYNNQSTKLFETLIHEIEHLHQFCNIEKGMVSHDIINMIKDKILSDELDGYYENNYQNISYEVDARVVGRKGMIDYFKALGYKLNIQELEEKQNLNRIHNNKIDNLNNIFNVYIIDHPELVKKYPQLLLEYEIKNNKVIRKSFQQMINDFEIIKKNNQMNENDKQVYFDYYKQLLIDEYNNSYEQEFQNNKTI